MEEEPVVGREDLVLLQIRSFKTFHDEKVMALLNRTSVGS
jgi:hypothetical protein